ncbi:echinoderm microtubule-associated protein-like 1 isoform X2 [Myripristis murdjan]|uniref:echinoderm microtubule-associated protein-like 1 isoform X2 n=1 Tax=Myripristis murdjan TaxID=586833 RepID=UPI0011762AD8|nr:echinoderm microtubule-associated protein-like 1 isoform X2 [Myripristis murdjan]
MAAGTAAGDTQMEELVDHGLGMEETAHDLLEKSPLRETYHSDTLLAPDTDFMIDDRSSAASGLEVADRLTYLEQRMQMQEEEIQLLKMALADVLKRLNISEEHQATASRRASTGKARPVSLALPPKAPMVTSTVASLKKSTTLPSAVTARNYTSSPTPSKSTPRSPAGSVKDGPCKTAKPRPASAASASKKDSSKSKDPAVGLGTRRVIHCKVTMQIYLSPLARRTGSSDTAKSAPTVPANSGPKSVPATQKSKTSAKTQLRKMTPTFTLNLQKTTTSQSTPLDTPKSKSPIKSPSQYFQICY